MNAKKLAKTGAGDYLVLNPIIAQTIITLQEYDFEHENHIYRLAACGSLALFDTPAAFVFVLLADCAMVLFSYLYYFSSLQCVLNAVSIQAVFSCALR